MTTPIARHGFLSDGHSAALVEPAGDITWWCTPRFDAPPACDALLGGSRRMTLRFEEAEATSFAYEPETNVLVTEWAGEGFRARVHDLMPYPGDGTCILRIARVTEGARRVVAESTSLYALHAGAPLDRPLSAGTTLVLATGPDTLRCPAPAHALAELDRTMRAWREWAARCSYHGPHRDLVVRSLLTLKALKYRPTGAIVAAPTTSLPEVMGGERNWDYRYAWIRDTGFCMDAFVSSGFGDDAHRLADWILGTLVQTPGKDMRVMYDIRGGPAPAESRVDLPGYAGSKPVRFGNGAVHQFQLDAYGHIMDCLHLWQHYREPRARDLWQHVVGLVERCRQVWREPDHGIWELPKERRQLTYSKVMAWVALDRAVKAARRHDLPAPVAEWERTRDEIRDVVLARGVDPETGAFTESFGSTDADASLLRLPGVGFIPRDDPRALATIDVVRARLLRGGLVRRYDADDGLAGEEGAFLACSFWLVEALALTGRRDEAAKLFDELAALAGPLGLFAEEYDAERREHLGNFPQAFTHAALVSAAWQLVDPATTRSRGEQGGARKKHLAGG